jgi:hypothetical protein
LLYFVSMVLVYMGFVKKKRVLIKRSLNEL